MQDKPEFFVIIAGPREGVEYAQTVAGIEASGWADQITFVLTGGAPGEDSSDQHGIDWAEERGIPFDVELADWSKHGRSAGPIRNSKMARRAIGARSKGARVGLIAVVKNNSRGTADMIKKATATGIEVFKYEID